MLDMFGNFLELKKLAKYYSGPMNFQCKYLFSTKKSFSVWEFPRCIFGGRAFDVLFDFSKNNSNYVEWAHQGKNIISLIWYAEAFIYFPG